MKTEHRFRFHAEGYARALPEADQLPLPYLWELSADNQRVSY